MNKIQKFLTNGDLPFYFKKCNQKNFVMKKRHFFINNCRKETKAKGGVQNFPHLVNRALRRFEIK